MMLHIHYLLFLNSFSLDPVCPHLLPTRGLYLYNLLAPTKEVIYNLLAPTKSEWVREWTGADPG